MPVNWSISHSEQIVLAAAEGEASVEDLERYILEMTAAGGLPYRKLFDMTYIASGGVRLADLRTFSKKVLELAKDGPMGPLAIVVGSALEQELAEMFGTVDAGRPLAIFSDVSRARAWLDGIRANPPA